MKLYSAKNSSGFAALVCLEEAGAKYELTLLDMAAGEQKQPEYLAVNARGFVPALVVDGTVITELLAVLTYVAAQPGGGGLIPANAIEKAKVYETLAWFSTTVHVAIAQIFRGERFSADPEARADVAACVGTGSKPPQENSRPWPGEAANGWPAMHSRSSTQSVWSPGGGSNGWASTVQGIPAGRLWCGRPCRGPPCSVRSRRKGEVGRAAARPCPIRERRAGPLR